MDNNFEKLLDDADNIEENLEYPLALIAFGYPEGSEKLFREQDDEIDRKSIKHVCKKIDKKYTDIIEAVRLSPSIKNSISPNASRAPIFLPTPALHSPVIKNTLVLGYVLASSMLLSDERLST